MPVSQILIFSDDKTLISLCSSALNAHYQIKIIEDLSNCANAVAVIIDAQHIDSNQQFFSLFNPKISRFLIIGNNWPEEYQINALVHGAAGYCNVTEAQDLLVLAIKSIVKGDIWIQRHLIPSVIGTLVKMKNTQYQKPPQQKQNNSFHLLKTLSRREVDVANKIRLGESNKVIASTLNISERTVKAHLTSIFKKLNVSDRLHLALFLKDSD